MRLAPILFSPLLLAVVVLGPSPEKAKGEKAETSSRGAFGGRLVIAQKAEPKTLNPITALDVVSREVLGLITSDLIHIDRASFQAVPALATSSTVSKDGRVYTLKLRRDARFSDGHPFDAGDVVFTFRVHLDERVHSPQRELLLTRGKPITVRRLDDYTVEFELAERFSGAERLFDSIQILPEHLLDQTYKNGELTKAWPLTAPANQIAGLGPFRMKEYVPGQRLVLERNPYYWKFDREGRRLPYLNEIVYQFVGTEDAQVLHLQSQQSHLIAGLSAHNFAVLQQRRLHKLVDLGPGLEYTFLLFNQNQLGSKHGEALRQKQSWFRQTAFRQAISAAIDRKSIVRLVYRGLASPIWTHVTNANKDWFNSSVPRPVRSLDRARQLLRTAGYSWNKSGRLLDPLKKEVGFSILTSAGNTQRQEIATIIQDDLKQLGIQASVVSMEFRAMLDRIFQTYEYEAAVMTMARADTDPNADMNVWTSKGPSRVWNLSGSSSTPWENELDELMQKQFLAVNGAERKRYYDRVQAIVAEYLPVICVVSPHVLVGYSDRLSNVQPSVLRPNLVWNAEQIYFRQNSPGNNDSN